MSPFVYMNKQHPRPPLNRKIKEGTLRTCPTCGSSLKRRWFRTIGCIHEECSNYWKRNAAQSHTHVTEHGVIVRCYHASKELLLRWQFWAGLTLGFPLEHLLWEKVWPFSLLTKWMGL